MPSNTEPLLPADQQPDTKERIKTQGKKCCAFCCLFVVVCLLIGLVVQMLIYWSVTAGCGPKVIGKTYKYPGGGKSDFGGPEYNLLPEYSLLTERQRQMWGWPFDLLPSNGASQSVGAQVGTFWRNWGPLWYTWTYEDIMNSKLTMYMRPNIWMPWMSYMIARCDGTGPKYTFTESTNWLSNKLRKAMHMNQAQSYYLYADSELVAHVSEVENGFPSFTYSNVSTGDEMGSAILNMRNFHGSLDQWIVSMNKDVEIPYFVSSALALPQAYQSASDKAGEEKAKAASKPDGSKHDEKFLVAGNAMAEHAEIPASLPLKATQEKVMGKETTKVSSAVKMDAVQQVEKETAKVSSAVKMDAVKEAEKDPANDLRQV